jgi:hypothetical protein
MSTSAHRRHDPEPEASAHNGRPGRALIVDDSPLVMKTGPSSSASSDHCLVGAHEQALPKERIYFTLKIKKY